MKLMSLTKSCSRKFLAAIAGILFFSGSIMAQSWRDIEPITSNCKDVERLFGGKACNKYETEYKLPTENIYIDFVKDSCQEQGAKGYDVPSGTITYIQVFLRRAHIFLPDLNIDLKKLKKGNAGDQMDIDVYESLELGIRVETSKEGKILTLTRFPAAKYDHLRCTSTGDTNLKLTGLSLLVPKRCQALR